MQSFLFEDKKISKTIWVDFKEEHNRQNRAHDNSGYANGPYDVFCQVLQVLCRKKSQQTHIKLKCSCLVSWQFWKRRWVQEIHRFCYISTWKNRFEGIILSSHLATQPLFTLGTFWPIVVCMSKNDVLSLPFFLKNFLFIFFWIRIWTYATFSQQILSHKFSLSSPEIDNVIDASIKVAFVIADENGSKLITAFNDFVCDKLLSIPKF